MSTVCPRCLLAFPRHLVVRARCAKRWRGANFDEQAAKGNVGAAVAGVLGMRVRTSAESEAFLRRVVVRTFGEGLDANPAAPFDANEGEAFEFHVGLREGATDETAEAVRREVVAAIAKSRHFSATDEGTWS